MNKNIFAVALAILSGFSINSDLSSEEAKNLLEQSGVASNLSSDAAIWSNGQRDVAEYFAERFLQNYRIQNCFTRMDGSGNCMIYAPIYNTRFEIEGIVTEEDRATIRYVAYAEKNNPNFDNICGGGSNVLYGTFGPTGLGSNSQPCELRRVDLTARAVREDDGDWRLN